MGVSPSDPGGRPVSDRVRRAQAQHLALWRVRHLRHLGQFHRWPRCAHGPARVAEQSRRQSLRAEFQRAGRRQRHGRRGELVPGRGLRLLRHRSRREKRRGAVAQRDDPETGRARLRHLGRRADGEALDDRRVGPAHLRSRARPRLLRIERRRTRLRGPARNDRRHHGRHQHALGGDAEDRRRSRGGTRPCRATTGTRNARSR